MHCITICKLLESLAIQEKIQNKYQLVPSTYKIMEFLYNPWQLGNAILTRL